MIYYSKFDILMTLFILCIQYKGNNMNFFYQFKVLVGGKNANYINDFRSLNIRLYNITFSLYCCIK